MIGPHNGMGLTTLLAQPCNHGLRGSQETTAYTGDAHLSNRLPELRPRGPARRGYLPALRCRL